MELEDEDSVKAAIARMNGEQLDGMRFVAGCFSFSSFLFFFFFGTTIEFFQKG